MIPLFCPYTFEIIKIINHFLKNSEAEKKHFSVRRQKEDKLDKKLIAKFINSDLNFTNSDVLRKMFLQRLDSRVYSSKKKEICAVV